MPQQGLILRALIASPGDLVAERKVIPEVIAAWNATHSFRRATIVEPVKWESHSTPLQGGRPQALINEQLGNRCDFLVGLFWTRLGTDTGVAASGTVEEIQEFLAEGKDVLLYFSKQPVVLDSVDSEQYRKLQEFKKDMRSKGLQVDYDSVEELKEVLSRHLNDVVNKILERLQWQPNSAPLPSNDLSSDVEELRSFIRSRRYELEIECGGTNGGIDEIRAVAGKLKHGLLIFAAEGDFEDLIRQKLKDLAVKAKQLENYQPAGFRSNDKYLQMATAMLGEIEQIADSI